MANERRKIRWTIAIFMVFLVLSGLTSFPLLWELNQLADILNIEQGVKPSEYSGLQFWIAKVRHGLDETYSKYPFLGYGTDWLAFAHVAIAVFFIGVLIDPVRNKWIILSGIIACLGVFPLALICGSIREIPFYWRLIDCSFGLFGAVPLLYALHLVNKVERLELK